MIVQQYRLERGWSQEQLAAISGLNVRTIQRIENGQPARLETYKALAAAFDVEFSQLQEAAVSEISKDPQKLEVALAFTKVRRRKAFYGHLFVYLVVNAGLVTLNLVRAPGHIWFVYPLLGWGIAVFLQAAHTFELMPWFGPEWERRAVEKQLGRALRADETPEARDVACHKSL